ncbi:MAG: hypothetical protein ABI824_10035 [Acidobacteriota bacterium]
MDADRKYKQNGYQDSGRSTNGSGNGSSNGHRGDDRRDERKPQGPRLPLDITGPRLPRLVQAVTASRCFNCTTQLAVGSDFPANCPKCQAALHCCKQCSYFEPSTRFQCLKPIPVRISPKDQANTCDAFKPRITVARDTASAPPPVTMSNATAHVQEPRNASDARTAFDNLFKKSE